MENLKKVKRIFRSPALGAVIRWSGCVRGSVALICALNAVSTLLSLGVTLVTKELIDGAVSGRAGTLWLWGGVLVAVTLALRGIGVILSLRWTKANARLQRSLQGMVAERTLGRDYAGLRRFHSGEMVNRFFSDAGVVREGIMGMLPGLVSTAVSFVGAAAILISMDWRFVPLLILGGGVGLGIVLLFRGPFKKRHKRMQEAEDALHSAVQETFENVRLVKAGVSENRFIRLIGGKQQRLEAEQIRQGRVGTLMNHGMGLVFNVSWLFCMLWGCVRISGGLMTYGALAAMIQLIGRIEDPIANAVGLASQAYGVIASAERLQELTDLPAEDGGEELDGFDEIRLRDVSFRYEDGTEDVLAHADAVFARGSFTALTGPSGGGKTSLFQLLLGIYRPTAGSVTFRLGDREVPASRGTRRLFAYVPQGNTLFSGTLRDNLTLFTETAAEEEILDAARTACIDDLVGSIGLDAALGERGTGLSEGQAQRVAVARALLTRAPILLLDECTSALDERTEARLLENLSALRDRTCIIVTHRRAALSICGRVLRVEDGDLYEVKKGAGA